MAGAELSDGIEPGPGGMAQEPELTSAGNSIEPVESGGEEDPLKDLLVEFKKLRNDLQEIQLSLRRVHADFELIRSDETEKRQRMDARIVELEGQFDLKLAEIRAVEELMRSAREK